MRKKKMFLNTLLSLSHQITVIVCGLILPRLFLINYGSSVNGLVASVTQFLGFISMLELGVGSVIQSSLYKPLAQNNIEKINKILTSGRKFFRKIAILFLIYTIILMIFYPILMIESFDYLFTLLLILIVSVSSFCQYYFGITYQLLLNADQKNYIQLTIQIITIILNTLLCVILIYAGFGIHWVKLATAIIYILRPICLSVYVKKHYQVNLNTYFDEEPIKQKWNGLAQHIASVVLNNTDILILTIFSSLENVSVYSVYYFVVYGVRQIVFSCTTGIQSLLGNMYAKDELELLKNSFCTFEWLIHTLVTLVFSCTAILIVPFVKIYTAGVTDVDYIVPFFALLLTLSQAVYCLRLPYNLLILAVGHYKQTQTSAIIEMLINLIVSIILVYFYGIVGVAIGTFIAMLYRTVYFSKYISKKIFFSENTNFSKNIMTDFGTMSFILLIANQIPINNIDNYFGWIIMSLLTFGACLVVVLLINLILYKQQFIKVVELILRR